MDTGRGDSPSPHKKPLRSRMMAAACCCFGGRVLWFGRTTEAGKGQSGHLRPPAPHCRSGFLCLVLIQDAARAGPAAAPQIPPRLQASAGSMNTRGSPGQQGAELSVHTGSWRKPAALFLQHSAPLSALPPRHLRAEQSTAHLSAESLLVFQVLAPASPGDIYRITE